VTAAPVRVSPSWLQLREPADAAARSAELVEKARAALPDTAQVIHDLGSGTGAMARWLAPRLGGPQHWVLHDWDSDLLGLAQESLPAVGDGSPVSVELRPGDITQLGPPDLVDGSLITASALLDLLTGPELERLAAACLGCHRPVLLTLSVTGRVEFSPPDPLDQRVAAAFNAHQRRVSRAGHRLLGPDAPARAAGLFTAGGATVHVRPSPWRLDEADPALLEAWFTGWLAAAVEQEPRLERVADRYAARRLADAEAGRLGVTVHHADLLALPSSRLG